ncbi:FAD:protein FMN transferase [Paenibacillus sp. SN-8-1]|uniref:FAD:protein FMN transferase n=1 Tax=Paenibacillus sp. SN-8-1 TaxID=3435409 RepID=UPI003D9A2B98
MSAAGAISPTWTAEFRAMNTGIEVHLSVPELSQFRTLAFKVQNWFEVQERRFSRFIPTSELCTLNASGGWVRVSAAMSEVLNLSLRFSRLSEGAFEPAVLPELERQGYDRTFEELENHPGGKTIGISGTCSGEPISSRKWLFDSKTRMFRRDTGTTLDLGGIVKSWCVQEISNWLRTQPLVEAARVNAGGDLAVWNRHAPGNRWTIHIEHPFEQDKNIASLELLNSTAATSSRSKRRWIGPDGEQAHHIIDPRTGKSAVGDIIQCTVLGSNLSKCEVISKSMCIFGETDGLAWLNRQSLTHTMIWVDKDCRIHYRGHEDQLNQLSAKLKPDIMHYI